MFSADYHTHSAFSSDSETEMDELVESALKKGIDEIAVTDHIDLGYPPVNYYIEEEFDYNLYAAEIERLREKYEGRLSIVQGTEIGLQTRIKDEIKTWLNGKQFDFIIGSTHIVDYKDLYCGDFFIGKDPHDAYMEYYLDVLKSVNSFDFFNVYGHLDCVIRYCAYPGYNHEDFREVIDEILKALIKKNKGIELNTSGLRYAVHAQHPRFEILKRYNELGGEIITIGSDAHKAKDVAADFKRARELLKDAGFRAVTSFRGGTPEFADI